jgi:signal transduction histidine kinase
LASIIDKRLALHQQLVQQAQENTTLKSQNVQLQALANLGSATSMIAHEINNLLTPLASYAALAVKNSEDKQLVTKVLEKTVRNCERASKIMISMLALANGQSEDVEKVKVQDMIEEVFTSLCRDFQKDSITVATEVPSDLAVPCVPVQIQQVLMNLVLNARDAMLPGGGFLKIAATENAEYVDLMVSDTGKGIPRSDLENIFKPFFTTKTGQDCSTTYSGSGVGLAFCRRVIDGHGGDISVTSTPGTGSVFRIRLPKSQPPQT